MSRRRRNGLISEDSRLPGLGPGFLCVSAKQQEEGLEPSHWSAGEMMASHWLEGGAGSA